MTTILCIALAIWLAKSFIQVAIGLGQIAAALLAGIAGVSLYIFASVLEGAYKLGKLALGK